MFTGIIEEVGKVASAGTGKLVVTAGLALEGMTPGASISVNGACLTMTVLAPGSFSADVMPETVMRTNLGGLRPGDRVNLERPLALGGQLGGHLVQGHVDDTGRVVYIRPVGGATMVRVEAAPGMMRYVVEKGFVAVDGISLTVASREARSFEVSIVDYTLKHTNLVDRRVGDLVNLEADIIAKYVEQLGGTRAPGLTAELLQEHGFMAR